jgi:Type II secretion system (T2SS), protein E, N-terminal domain
MTFKKAISWLNTCANPACRAKPVRTRLLCSGAYVGQARYCSPDCLRAGLAERFAELTQQPRSVPVRRQHRIPLGLELVSRGCIKGDTLKTALQQQKQTPEVRLGQILINMGAVSEEQITSAIAAQWSVPVFRLDPSQVPEAAQFLPVALMERYKMLPVHFVKQTNKLHLAFAQVVDHSILYAIQQMLGVTTEACIADESALVRVVGSAAHQERPAEYVLNSLSGTELVSMIAGYALRLRSERISAANCNDQIWVRAVSRPSIATHFLASIATLQPAALALDEY